MQSRPCPRCGDDADLELEKAGGHSLLVCLRCEGVLVAQRDLRRLAEFLSRKWIGTAALGDPALEEPALGQASHPPGPLPCACGRSMDAFPYLGEAALILDRCESCEVVWLDTGEIEAVARVFTRSEARIRQLHAEACRNQVRMSIGQWAPLTEEDDLERRDRRLRGSIFNSLFD